MLDFAAARLRRACWRRGVKHLRISGQATAGLVKRRHEGCIMKTFKRLLVANRGEIAARDADRKVAWLPHRAVYSKRMWVPRTRLADDVSCWGGHRCGSYLNVDRILAAAAATGAEAIHPGYGFLSENAVFAQAVEDAGLVFIGPSAESITLMGNKAAAKRRMQEAGVPCVPGYEGHDQSDAALTAAARQIGYPLMVKAAAGGGGRGMRLVRDEAMLPEALRAARPKAAMRLAPTNSSSSEQSNDHGTSRSGFADTLGNTIHLGERDCSVQRRHQKVGKKRPAPS
jgi:geranyl-CoA carboxylase alpha subunit